MEILSKVPVDGFGLDPVFALDDTLDLLGVTNRYHAGSKDHNGAIFAMKSTSKPMAEGNVRTNVGIQDSVYIPFPLECGNLQWPRAELVDEGARD
jgi:hypothetical protein